MSGNNKAIKVLQVFASLNIGGAESRMMDVYRGINRSQIQFDFVTLEEKKQFFEDEIITKGGKVFHISSPRKIGLLRHIRQLRQCIRQGQYQAVHAHTSYHCGCVMLAAYLEKVPVRVSHARTTGSIHNGIKTKIFVASGRILNALFSTKRVAISEEAGRFVFGKRKFEVIPNAIDLSKYENLNRSCDLRLRLRIPKNAIVIGHVGRFDRFKNQKFAIEWFTDFNKGNEAFLVLVGDGELRKEAEESAKFLGIPDRVIFTGIREDIPQLMSMFDMLIFPSIVEGLGGVVIEAQAAGTPAVVSTAIPNEVDMGLKMIEKCSLQDEMRVWNIAAERSLTKNRPQYSEIRKAFDDRKYSLDYAIDRLSSIYSQKDIE